MKLYKLILKLEHKIRFFMFQFKFTRQKVIFKSKIVNVYKPKKA